MDTNEQTTEQKPERTTLHTDAGRRLYAALRLCRTTRGLLFRCRLVTTGLNADERREAGAEAFAAMVPRWRERRLRIEALTTYRTTK